MDYRIELVPCFHRQPRCSVYRTAYVEVRERQLSQQFVNLNLWPICWDFPQKMQKLSIQIYYWN